jgi:beta-glucosidase
MTSMAQTTAVDHEAELAGRLAQLSLEQKVRLMTGADIWSLHSMPEIGLRRLVTSDGPAGVRGETWDERSPSANVPSPTALAASWDPVRVERMGRLLASEARRKGVDVLLAPTVNLHRTPYGGRHFECFSEDPELTAMIGTAYVSGLQAEASPRRSSTLLPMTPRQSGSASTRWSMSGCCASCTWRRSSGSSPQAPGR